MALNEPNQRYDRRYYVALACTAAAALALAFLSAQLPWYVAVGALAFLVAVTLALKEPLTGILLVTFLLPFERIGAYQLGGTNIRLSQVMFAVTIAVWFANLVARKRYSLAANPVLVPLALFLAANVVSLPTAISLNRSLLVLLYIAFTTLLVFVLPNIIRTTGQLQKVVVVLLISFTLVSAFGVFQFLGDMSGLPTSVTGLRELYTRDILGFTRVQSTAHEPLYFANYLLLPLALLFTFFLSGRGILRAGWLIALFGLGMVNLVLTVSRGGYLAVAATIFVIGLFYARKFFSPRNIIIFFCAALAVGWVAVRALGVGGEAFTLEKFQEHVRGVFYGASYNERLDTFEQAVTAWRGHPWFGIGVGSFGPYTAPHPAYEPKDGWKIVNNEYVEVLAENGLIGLACFAILLLVLAVRSVKAITLAPTTYLRAAMVGSFAAFIGIMVQYLSFSTLYIMHVWFAIGLLVVIQNIIFNSCAATGRPPAARA